MSLPLNVQYPIVLGSLPTIWRGDPYQLTLSMFQSDGTTPQDLTGFGSAWSSHMRAAIGSSVIAATWTVDVTHLTDGYVVLSLTDVQTAALRKGQSYGFDVQATGGTMTPFTVWQARSVAVDGEWTHA